MILLQPWAQADIETLKRTVGDATMMQHLGGVENEQQMLVRHARYLALEVPGGMFTIRDRETTEIVGTVGFWARTWHDHDVYECGWMVFPEWSGRGIASVAGRAIVARARATNLHRFMHAFPAVENAASNRVCESVGFTDFGPCSFEYPRGSFMQSNDWRVDLHDKAASS